MLFPEQAMEDTTRSREAARTAAQQALVRLRAGEPQQTVAAGGTSCPVSWPLDSPKLRPGETTEVRESPFGYFIVVNPR